jgi:hypothetical protein
MTRNQVIGLVLVTPAIIIAIVGLIKLFKTMNKEDLEILGIILLYILFSIMTAIGVSLLTGKIN